MSDSNANKENDTPAASAGQGRAQSGADQNAGGAKETEAGIEDDVEEDQLSQDYQSTGATKDVIFRKKVKVLPDQPIPKYDRGEVKAYRGVGIGKADGHYIVYICDPALMPRMKSSNVYASLINKSMARLFDYGLIFWAPTKQQRMCYIYEDNWGDPILEKGRPHALGWKQERVMASIIKPMVGVLSDFRDKEFIHGSISPGNMFYGGPKGDKVKLVMGECLVTPTSYTQHTMYEAIPRSMAQPIGRGVGTLESDLYSLGVTIAVFMRSRDPMEGLSDEEVIARKVELGSYAAVTGKDRFKGSILELLRGLLNDDPLGRWTIMDVEAWLGGERISSKQAKRRIKAPRPMTFAGERHFNLERLAMAVVKHPAELEKLVEGDDLQQWLSRAMEDEERIERLNLAIASSDRYGKSNDYKEMLASDVSSALDPEAPFRYKDMSVRADMFGHVLMQAMLSDADLNPYASIITKGALTGWIANYDDPQFDKANFTSRFERCRNYIKQSKPGSGIERCVYTLMPYAPCLSPKLRNFCVRGPDELVMAFEKMMREGEAPGLFLDRHCIAFLVARESRVIEGALFDLESKHRHKQILANLVVFAIIQKKSAIKKLPHLCKAFITMMPEVLAFVHDQTLREKIEKAALKCANEGSLFKMAEVLANMKVYNNDFRDFKVAMLEYSNIRKELLKFDYKLENKITFGKNIASDIAAFLASMIAGIIILTLTFMFLDGKVLFDVP